MTIGTHPATRSPATGSPALGSPTRSPATPSPATRSPATRRVAARAVALATVVAVLLAGCEEKTTASEPVSDLADDVVFTPVDVPAAMRATADAPAVWGMTAVPAVAALPRLTVGRVNPGPSGKTQVRIWSVANEAALTKETTLDLLEHDVTAVSAAGSAAITAISGYTWNGTVNESFLLTSTDRSAWTKVELDAAARAVRTRASGADDQHVVLAGDGLSSRQPAVVVHAVATGETATTALPDLDDEESQSVTGVAVAGDVVVVTAELGPRGKPATPVSYVSTDAGATFGAAQEVTPSARADVAGVVWTGTEFVATGSARPVAQDDNRPAAWSSPDGAHWTADGLAHFGTDPLDWASVAEPAGLSSPTTSNGEVAVAITQSANPFVYLRLRTADGDWSEPVATAEQASATPSAVVVRTATGMSAAIWASGTLAEFRTVDGGATSTATLSSWAEPFGVASLHALPGAVGIAAERSDFEFTRLDDGRYGWSQSTEPAHFTVAAGAFTEQVWGPPELATHSAPEVGTDPASGVTVVAALTRSDRGFPMHAWTQLPGGDWQPATGIAETGFQYPTAIERTSAGWLLAAQTAQTGTSEDVRAAALWSSPDGLAWTAESGQFQTATGEGSSISAICEVPGGPIAVGWATDADEIAHATAWRSDGGQWTPVSLTDDPGSSFSSCVGTDTGARLSGSNGSQDVTWETSDLSSFAVVETLADGGARGTPVAVDGGFFAPGRIDSEAFTGRVLWLSADGARWRWVPIPTAGSNDAVDVAPLGADLLVTSQGVGTTKAWMVKDVASALATPGTTD